MDRHTSTTSSPTSPNNNTTFVQADASTFRDLVQKLTGLETDYNNSSQKHPSKPSKASQQVDLTGPRRSPFKLQERRHTMRKLEIKLGLLSSPSRQTQRVDSPVLPNPATHFESESLFFRSPGTESPSSLVSEEEKAIAEKGFYLHPSPLSTPGGGEPPELLTLFPLTSSRKGNEQD